MVFSTSEQAIAGGSVRLSVKDGQQAKISVQLVDIYSDASGTKRPIPLDSSPFTPKGLVKLSKTFPDYYPSDKFQYFDVSVKFRDDIALDRPVLGGISISLVPEKKSGSQVGVESSIIATFAYLPATGINFQEYSPDLTLTVPTVSRVTPDFFPLNLLPEIPLFLNHGDVRLDYQLKNTGKIFLETQTDLQLQQLGFFGQPDKLVFSDSQELFMVPNQVSERSILVAPSESANGLLGIGAYRIDLSARGKLGSQIDTSTSNQLLLFIFPWKQTLIALGVLIFTRRKIYRALKSVFALGKAFGDFLNTRNQKPISQQRAVTPVLVTSSSTVATNSASRPLYAPPAPAPTTTPSPQMPESSDARPLYPYWYQPPNSGS